MGLGLPSWILHGFPTIHGSYTVPWVLPCRQGPDGGEIAPKWPQNEESLQDIMFHDIPASREALQMLAPQSGIAPMYCATQYSSSQRDSADIGSRIRNRSKALCFTVFQLPETVCGCWLHNQEPFESVVFHSIPAFREGLRMLAP